MHVSHKHLRTKSIRECVRAYWDMLLELLKAKGIRPPTYEKLPQPYRNPRLSGTVLLRYKPVVATHSQEYHHTVELPKSQRYDKLYTHLLHDQLMKHVQLYGGFLMPSDTFITPTHLENKEGSSKPKLYLHNIYIWCLRSNGWCIMHA